jgi:hypothetical protein
MVFDAFNAKEVKLKTVNQTEQMNMQKLVYSFACLYVYGKINQIFKQ